MNQPEIPSRPRIIVLDGHDGAGKTTLARLAAEALATQFNVPLVDTTHASVDESLEKILGIAAPENGRQP